MSVCNWAVCNLLRNTEVDSLYLFVILSWDWMCFSFFPKEVLHITYNQMRDTSISPPYILYFLTTNVIPDNKMSPSDVCFGLVWCLKSTAWNWQTALNSIEPTAKVFTDEPVFNKKTSLRGVCILTLNDAWAQLFGHHSLTHVVAANHVSGHCGTDATQWTTCLNITLGTMLD